MPAMHDALLTALTALSPRLDALRRAALPDAWLAAGMIRNRVWDQVLGPGGPPDRDWDVAFCGAVDDDVATARLNALLPGPWEAVDQAAYGHASTAHGLASWPETATAIGARWTSDGLQVLAPWGLEDLLQGVIRRAPLFHDIAGFKVRQAAKRWPTRWPGLRHGDWRPDTPGPALAPVRLRSPHE